MTLKLLVLSGFGYVYLCRVVTKTKEKKRVTENSAFLQYSKKDHFHLNCLNDERGNHVERHPHQVEKGEADEGRLRVQHVVGIDQNKGRKRGQRDEERRSRKQKRLNGTEVGSFLQGHDLFTSNVADLLKG